MGAKLFIRHAADILLGGGIVTCPTEGVFGLSCMPDDPGAVASLLVLKQRDPAKGLILIGADAAQLGPWIAASAPGLPAAEAGHPVTWIVPAAAGVSPLVRGDHATVAVRISGNPVAAALCSAVGSPLVSTSANRAGRPVARNRFVLRRRFAACVDYIVPGDCGPASGPSEIRDLLTGEVLRPRPS